MVTCNSSFSRSDPGQGNIISYLQGKPKRQTRHIDFILLKVQQVIL